MIENLPIERIERKIYLIRGQKVMLDRDLAELYGVETRVLAQAIKRNPQRFPNDFMFSLTRSEIMNISQIVICSRSKEMENIKHARNVNVFTENGIAMLSSVLHSEQAIQVNIQIMRAFTQLRFILSSNKEMLQKVNDLERETKKNSSDIQLIFEAIRKILTIEEKPKRPIGFLRG